MIPEIGNIQYTPSYIFFYLFDILLIMNYGMNFSIK